MLELVRPAAKDLLGKNGHVVTKGQWLPPMVFATLLVLAADTVHKRLRPGSTRSDTGLDGPRMKPRRRGGRGRSEPGVRARRCWRSRVARISFTS